MPFFALGDLVIDWFVSKFGDKYYERRFRRGDNTLRLHLFHGIAAKLNQYRDGIYNTFACCKCDVLVESGTQDGNKIHKNYYLMDKKIYSNRFSTDCFSDFFNKKALKSKIGIDDVKEYAGQKATLGELKKQNSYFINDLLKYYSFKLLS